MIGTTSKADVFAGRELLISTVKSYEPVLDADMRTLLRGTKSKASTDEGQHATVEVLTLVSNISGQSIQHIDDLIVGLQGLRMRVDDQRARIERDIRSHAAFSQSIVELANIVAEGMAAIKSANAISGIDDVASRSESHAK